ncbi:MAG TPA: hypothetical protein VMU51_37005 [Mycobacteriales bacterium]|nr:hypothetical protein [Mycobacteriales bacterium]
MAKGRSAGLVPPRTVAMVVAMTLAAGLLAPAAPAVAAPEAPAASAIVAGAATELVDYQVATYLAPAEGDAGADDIEDVQPVGEACQPLQGVVTEADINAAVGTGPPPTGDGAWQYEVCAEDEEAASDIAGDHSQVDDAKRYCGPPHEDKIACTVVIHWVPVIPVIPPSNPESRQTYLRSLFDFAPVLEASPGFDPPNGLIANLPTWFWNTVVTEFPKLVPGGHAWHLWTEFHTNNERACRRSGLNKVGTVYRVGESNPGAASPTGCGYTYRNQGRYEVRGCTRWLFVIVALFAPIVFAATFCHSDTVTVKEVQVVSGGAPRRIPVPIN